MKFNIKKEKPTNSVTFFMNGGLGNQMFQYAFGRTVADRRSCELILNTSELRNYSSGVTPRSYSLASFNIRACTDTKVEYNTRLSFLLAKRFPKISQIFSLRFEPHHSYQESISIDDSSNMFYGYWQSHHYFTKNSNRIFKDFTPKKPLSTQASGLVELIKLSNSVMIHVRRGDYISSKLASSFHSSLPLDYYFSAYNTLCKTIENPSFFIFSDDIEWCRENFRFIDRPISFIPSNLLPADWEDLIVMSYCKHHIIANSSFSWWSAWLADQRYGTTERFVFAPLQWFVKDSINPKDRFPNHWRTL